MRSRIASVGAVCLLISLSLTLTGQGPLQRGSAVVLTGAPPPGAQQTITDFSTGNPTYICYAGSDVGESSPPLTVSAATNASPVVLTVAAHGFDYQSLATTTPVVKLQGFTGTWAALNGIWVATPTSANALSVAVDSASFGAMTGTPILTTRAPRTTQRVWAIQKYVYDASGNPIWSGWADEAGGHGFSQLPTSSAISFNFVCANRSTYGYE